MLRQSYVLSALAGYGLPVPRVTAREDDDPAWFAMELCDGEAVEPVLDVGTDLDPRHARERMTRAARVLGTLHTVPQDALAEGVRRARAAHLPDPATPADELARWERRWTRSPRSCGPEAPSSSRRSASTSRSLRCPSWCTGTSGSGTCSPSAPSPPPSSTGRSRASATRASTSAGSASSPTARCSPGAGRVLPRLPDEDELAELYRSAGGTLPTTPWVRALARMKMAAIMGHNLRRHREGRHHDPVQEQLPPTIAALIDSARACSPGARRERRFAGRFRPHRPHRRRHRRLVGLGPRFAAVLAAAGATVWTAARREHRLRELAAGCPRLRPVAADLATDDGRRALVETVRAGSGTIDLLINNAGTDSGAKPADETSERFAEVLGTNLVAPFHLARLAAMRPGRTDWRWSTSARSSGWCWPRRWAGRATPRPRPGCSG